MNNGTNMNGAIAIRTIVVFELWHICCKGKYDIEVIMPDNVRYLTLIIILGIEC